MFQIENLRFQNVLNLLTNVESTFAAGHWLCGYADASSERTEKGVGNVENDDNKHSGSTGCGRSSGNKR